MPEYQVKKLWCICLGVMGHLVEWGRLEGGSHVRYSESQLYSPDVWDMKYLLLFETPEEMINEYAKREGISIKTAESMFLQRFSSMAATLT